MALPAPRERRTHAARTAETRARLIGAVVDCIAEGGYQGITATEVTRRAGVTWGAVQHHFGGKDGMLMAVLEDSFDRFARRIAEVPFEGMPLERRADEFVDAAWDHFSGAHYRATFEILLNELGPREASEQTDWRGQMLRAWDEVWRRLFVDSGISRRRKRVLQHYTVSVLSGLASTLMLEGPEATPLPGELDLLRETLRRELAK